jgi:hypothetical protein
MFGSHLSRAPLGLRKTARVLMLDVAKPCGHRSTLSRVRFRQEGLLVRRAASETMAELAGIVATPIAKNFSITDQPQRVGRAVKIPTAFRTAPYPSRSQLLQPEIPR